MEATFNVAFAPDVGSTSISCFLIFTAFFDVLNGLCNEKILYVWVANIQVTKTIFTNERAREIAHE